MDLRDRVFVGAIVEIESLVGTGGELELTATVPWLRRTVDKIVRFEAHKIKDMKSTERLTWAEKHAAEWMPWNGDVAELVRVCAEWRVWDMPGIASQSGPLGEIAYAYVKEVTETVLFAMAEHIAETSE